MKKGSLYTPKVLLIFDGTGILSSMSRSIRSAAEYSDSNAQAISFACTGRYISAGAYYYRHLHPNVEVDTADLGILKIRDYDDMCSEVRRYHPSNEMVRQRILKNNKRVRKKSNFNNNNDNE